jgi:hypothetical protein
MEDITEWYFYRRKSYLEYLVRVVITSAFSFQMQQRGRFYLHAMQHLLQPGSTCDICKFVICALSLSLSYMYSQN